MKAEAGKALADITESGGILLTGPAEATFWAHSIPGAKKGRDGSWTMPATLDTCTDLRKHRNVAFSEALASFETRAEKVQKYIEYVKRKETVEPLQPVPIKAPYKLYMHQIKAYNITLALFGRGASKKGGSNAHG